MKGACFSQLSQFSEDDGHMFCSCGSSLTVVSMETGRTVSRIEEVRLNTAHSCRVAGAISHAFSSLLLPSAPLCSPQEEDVLTSLAVSRDGKVNLHSKYRCG